MPNDSYLTEQYMDRLDDLTAAMEAGDNQRINRLLSELTTLRETSLYRELGMLTREIHDSIRAFADDDRIATLAQDEIPDAKQRLQLIVTKTDEAAHRTMTGAEAPAADEISAAEFEALLDDMHGKGRGPGSAQKPATPKQPAAEAATAAPTQPAATPASKPVPAARATAGKPARRPR